MTRGSRAEFERLMLPHLDRTYNLARWLLRHPYDAEDAVQEAYLRAYRRFDGYAGGSSAAWMLKIVRNVCMSQLKRKDGDRNVISLDTVLAQNDAPFSEGVADEKAIHPDAALIEKTEQITVRRAVDGLPAYYREIVVLREFEDLSYQQIAEIVGIPVGTVMSRLSRARQLLRHYLSTSEMESQRHEL